MIPPSVAKARQHAKECRTAYCIGHAPLINLLVGRILIIAAQLGEDAECIHQELHLDLEGRQVSFESTVRWRTPEGWVAERAEEPSRERACFQLVIVLEARLRAALGAPVA